MSALERLQGIQDKFQKSVDPSAYLKSKPQVAPGSAATKVMLNKPGTAGINPPVAAPMGLMPRLMQGMSTMGQAILPIQIGSILGETYAGMDRAPAVSGRGAGRATFNPPSNVNPATFKGKKGLSTLQPGDDIPKSQYPAGVPTGVGGGNAGQSQSVNPDASGYIPPTGKPLSVGTDTSSGGREVVSDADEAMRIWAQTHGQLADKVIDKVENRGLKQAGYDIIKSVRQPGESAEFPVTMAGEKPEIAYSDDNKGVETLNRDGMEAFPVEMKAENSTSAFSPAFGAQNFLKDYMSGLKGKDSADFEVDILSTPAELQDPVVMPSSAASFEAPSLQSKLDPSQFESMSKNMPKRR